MDVTKIFILEKFTGTGQFDLIEAFQLINNVPIEFAIYDLDGKYKYVNEQYLSVCEIYR